MSAACILVIDDNPTNLKLVSDVLECEGYEILRANDADAALRIIEQRLPDLVLVDIALPGMDGLALTRKLRAQARTRQLKIVALTAFAMPGDEEKARAAGCDGYITKPIDTRKLPAQIAVHLQNPEPPASKSGLKILVIEDTPTELKLALHVLASAGHNVYGAMSAAQAFEVVKQNRPDIILLDMMLPGPDGLALARMLKADPMTRDIQIVAVTAFPEEFSRQAALDAGCDAFLIKPIDTGGLAGHMEDVARRASLLPPEERK